MPPAVEQRPRRRLSTAVQGSNGPLPQQPIHIRTHLHRVRAHVDITRRPRQVLLQHLPGSARARARTQTQEPGSTETPESPTQASVGSGRQQGTPHPRRRPMRTMRHPRHRPAPVHVRCPLLLQALLPAGESSGPPSPKPQHPRGQASHLPPGQVDLPALPQASGTDQGRAAPQGTSTRSHRPHRRAR